METYFLLFMLNHQLFYVDFSLLIAFLVSFLLIKHSLLSILCPPLFLQYLFDKKAYIFRFFTLAKLNIGVGWAHYVVRRCTTKKVRKERKCNNYSKSCFNWCNSSKSASLPDFLTSESACLPGASIFFLIIYNIRY